MKNLIIIGAGGVGKETAWIVEQINSIKETYNILGFVDDNKEIWNKYINGYTVLGGLKYILENEVNFEVVIAIANYKVKKNIVSKLKEKKIKYATIIHPSLNIPKGVKVGQGTILYEGVIISPNVSIGNQVIVSPKSGIGHDSIIKDYVSVLWNVSISGNDLIEEGVLLGSSSTVIQGKVIGCGAIVGAGSVVVRNIKENRTVVGVPAKIIN
ncbi:acetyltransferase [Clostridium perfringens]|uniref:acetyltransferase n=1 Tax=Clostridium perfringens TaxID=1502 RepID=UPI001A2D4D59|nr:acetyltransferase [Clostridium perfringens]MDZ4906154.1 transferase [Clostridium perfringens]HAT4224174.1 acetyltransferase [Clostridium perfringens]